jgi:hypothetical protein
MLFPRNALASGLQACFFAGKRIAKVGKLRRIWLQVPSFGFPVET